MCAAGRIYSDAAVVESESLISMTSVLAAGGDGGPASAAFNAAWLICENTGCCTDPNSEASDDACAAAASCCCLWSASACCLRMLDCAIAARTLISARRYMRFIAVSIATTVSDDPPGLTFLSC